MQIHSPLPEQYGVIRRLLTGTFGQPDEAVLVERQREDQAVAIELVLEQDGAILGHVALSWLSSPSAALTLAPVAVLPARQG